MAKKNKYQYPQGMGPWMVEPFPVDKRKRFVDHARKINTTVPTLLEKIIDEYLETPVK